MELNITIGNGTESNSHYVGRNGKGKTSALGNPYKPEAKNKEAYEAAIKQYKRWLWEQVKPSDLTRSLNALFEIYKIIDKAKTPEGVSLFCPGFCTQQGLPCHAKVIKACCEWLDFDE